MIKKINKLFNATVFVRIFFLLITIWFIYMQAHYYNVENKGIPVKCRILSVVEVQNENIRGMKGKGSIHEETFVKYIIDQKEYIDTIKLNLGEEEEIVELVYIPSNPDKVYSLEEVEISKRVLNYVMVGFYVFFLVMKVLLDYVFKYIYGDSME